MSSSSAKTAPNGIKLAPRQRTSMVSFIYSPQIALLFSRDISTDGQTAAGRRRYAERAKTSLCVLRRPAAVDVPILVNHWLAPDYGLRNRQKFATRILPQPPALLHATR